VPLINFVDKRCKNVGWRTPERIVLPVHNYFVETTGLGIYLDPATEIDNPVRAETYYTETQDGLKQDWECQHLAGNELVKTYIEDGLPFGVFVNPPYGKVIPTWIEKIGDEARKGRHIVALLPASRTETHYWQSHLINERLSAILYVRKRLRFIDSSGKPQGGNPYASTLMLFNGDVGAFYTHLRAEGKIVAPVILG